MQSFQELLLLIFHTGKTPLSKETCVLEPCCSQSKEWQSLLVKLMLSLLFALQNLSSFLKVSGTWECEVGACSCLTWSHENTLSGKRTFQALRLPRVVRNVVCGFWIFTIHWKESALKQLVPWLLEGQAYICMLGMSPVKFQLSLFSYYFFKDAEHRSYLCLLLRSANGSLHKVSLTRMAARSLHIFFWLLHPPSVFISALQAVHETDVR